MKKIRHAIKKPGLTPGSLIHSGERKAENVRIRVIRYNADELTEQEFATVDECLALAAPADGVIWINIDGLHEPGIIEKIGERYRIHPLVLEDILHPNQRPKVEEFEDHIFAVLRMFVAQASNGDIDSHQFSLLIGHGWLVTFQECPGHMFDPVIERLRSSKGSIRTSGADYLAYALIDAVVDNYFVVLDRISDRIDALENAVLKDPTPDILKRIHETKTGLGMFRKFVVPLREPLAALSRREPDIIGEGVKMFFSDVHDHVIQLIDSLDTFRDMVSGLLDVYLSSISNRMNAVMKLLTIFAAIFIPLTFIAGVYGMNFEYMPELRWRFGYPVLLVFMMAIAVSMLIIFRRKKWL